jgi:hypothetical protein
MIIAAIEIGSKSMPHNDKNPRMPIQIDKTHAEAITTVKMEFRNRKQTAAIHSKVPATDCHESEGMLSIKSRKTASSWKTDGSNSGYLSTVSLH